MAYGGQGNAEVDESLYSQTPLMVLRLNTLDVLGQYFNSEKLLTSNSGHLRDWRGLASAAQLNFEDTHRLKSHANPTREIISIWCQQISEKSNRKVSVKELFDLLINKLDRRDVVDSEKVKGNIPFLLILCIFQPS